MRAKRTNVRELAERNGDLCPNDSEQLERAAMEGDRAIVANLEVLKPMVLRLVTVRRLSRRTASEAESESPNSTNPP